MDWSNRRPLYNNVLVQRFLVNALGQDWKPQRLSRITNLVVSAEMNIERLEESDMSANSRNYRDHGYQADHDRDNLKNKIIIELLTLPRLKDDEMIRLGKGGAQPNTTPRAGRTAYIVIGLPASGKSSVCSRLADHLGAYIIDSDYAKRKLPEYRAQSFGATLVHEESNEIVFGPSKNRQSKPILEHCLAGGVNVVIPKIGGEPGGIISLANILLGSGYEVHLTLVELSRKKATQRALNRFLTTKRYVPLGLIFDTYADAPTITYYKVKHQLGSKLKSYGILSTDVPMGHVAEKIEGEADNPADIFVKLQEEELGI